MKDPGITEARAEHRYVSGTVLSTLLLISQKPHRYLSCHFTDEDSDVKALSQGHAAHGESRVARV